MFPCQRDIVLLMFYNTVNNGRYNMGVAYWYLVYYTIMLLGIRCQTAATDVWVIQHGLKDSRRVAVALPSNLWSRRRAKLKHVRGVARNLGKGGL